MRFDILQLRDFYYRTSLGKLTQRSLQRALREIWPQTKGEVILGAGYAAPLLRPFLAGAERVFCLMPAQQGANHWPVEGPNRVVLFEEENWPLQDASIDRIIIAHGLETSESSHTVLDEAWRVLRPEGRMMLVVPNRSGLWAQVETTPFGFGRPYTLGQLQAQLEQHGFEKLGHRGALFGPPFPKRFWIRLSRRFEKYGVRIGANRIAGVYLVEAKKRVYSGLALKAERPRRGRVVLPVPAGVLPTGGGKEGKSRIAKGQRGRYTHEKRT